MQFLTHPQPHKSCPCRREFRPHVPSPPLRGERARERWVTQPNQLTNPLVIPAKAGIQRTLQSTLILQSRSAPDPTGCWSSLPSGERVRERGSNASNKPTTLQSRRAPDPTEGWQQCVVPLLNKLFHADSQKKLLCLNLFPISLEHRSPQSSSRASSIRSISTLPPYLKTASMPH